MAMAIFYDFTYAYTRVCLLATISFYDPEPHGVPWELIWSYDRTPMGPHGAHVGSNYGDIISLWGLEPHGAHGGPTIATISFYDPEPHGVPWELRC